jgi:hypothetical protein
MNRHYLGGSEMRMQNVAKVFRRVRGALGILRETIVNLESNDVGLDDREDYLMALLDAMHCLQLATDVLRADLVERPVVNDNARADNQAKNGEANEQGEENRK